MDTHLSFLCSLSDCVCVCTAGVEGMDTHLSFLCGLSDCVECTLIRLIRDRSDSSLVSEASLCKASSTSASANVTDLLI